MLRNLMFLDHSNFIHAIEIFIFMTFRDKSTYHLASSMKFEKYLHNKLKSRLNRAHWNVPNSILKSRHVIARRQNSFLSSQLRLSLSDGAGVIIERKERNGGGKVLSELLTRMTVAPTNSLQIEKMVHKINPWTIFIVKSLSMKSD